MARVVRSQVSVIVAVGAGMLLGSGLTLLLHRLSGLAAREIRMLFSQIDDLQREVRELKASIDRLLQSQLPSGVHKTNPVTNVATRELSSQPSAITAETSSTGEEQDLFEDALENGTEYNSSHAVGVQRGQRDKPVTVTGVQENSVRDAGREELYRCVDDMVDGSDTMKEEAYNLLKDKSYLVGFSGDPQFLWRLGKSTYQMAQIYGSRGNEEEKKSLVYESREHVFNALQLDPSNYSVQKWCAITIGSVGDYESTQVRIANGFKFKEHIVNAIELCPTDPSSHHLLGRWCYGVYMLSWIERQAAATLFAAPPTATIDEALTEFMEAEKLKPGTWKDNLLYIAKCHIAMGHYYKAVEWLDKASVVPCVGHEDETSQTEVDKLLYTYGGYRR